MPALAEIPISDGQQRKAHLDTLRGIHALTGEGSFVVPASTKANPRVWVPERLPGFVGALLSASEKLPGPEVYHEVAERAQCRDKARPWSTLGDTAMTIVYRIRVGGADPGKTPDAPLSITAPATDRLRAYHTLLEKIRSIINEQSRRLSVPVRKIIVRPEWSHEYEDKTGVLIEADVSCDVEKRFVFWDSISEAIHEQSETLPEKDRKFLTENVSVVVVEA